MSFVVDIPGFDLGKSIESGQIFRFAKIEDGVYKIWAKDYVCGMTQVPDGVRVDTMTDSAEEKDFWESWLPKPFDPAELEAIMSTNPVLKEAHEYSKGSYLFRQYPFECLMDFIASQRNSIARISQIMFTLCNICGDLLPDTSFAFPRPEQITREAVLTPRAGYRASYLYNAAQEVACGNLVLEDYTADKVSYQTAMARLQRLTGVGVKIADCVALFSLGFTNAFPVDIHIQRVLELEGMRNFREEDCGAYAGLVQQYLYNYALHNKL